MNLFLAKIDPTMLALMHSSIGGDNKLQPYSREILLVECHLSGVSCKDVTAVEPTLAPGAVLTLQREPDNAHDALAIRVYDPAGQALGYIPRIANAALARLMDAGKHLFARLESKQWHGDWLKVEVAVFMRDL
jgi:hypothetical protein